MKRILLATLLAAAPAFADTAPMSERVFGPNSEVKVGTLCSSQTATSTGCTNSSINDQIVADLRGYTSVAFYANQSTATTFTCDVYTSDNGYDADSGVGQDRSTTAISETQTAIVLDGALAFAWIECSAIADNQVTITFVASK